MTLYRFPALTLLSRYRRRHSTRRAERAQRVRHGFRLLLIPLPLPIIGAIPDLAALLLEPAPHMAPIDGGPLRDAA